MSSHGFESHPFRRLILSFASIFGSRYGHNGNMTGFAVLGCVPSNSRWRNGNVLEDRPVWAVL